MNARKMETRGQVHVYTGNGKGKTTAAFGLAIRACMAGKKVFIGQFMKSMQYNETRIARYIDNLSVEQFGNGCILTRAPTRWTGGKLRTECIGAQNFLARVIGT